MEEALSFFSAFEIWIYLVIGLGALYYLRKFILAWGEYRQAAFGLERENAQTHLNRSVIALVLLLVMAVSEFILVYFVAPSVPGAIPISTPTLSLMATPTTTLPVLTPPPEVVPTGAIQITVSSGTPDGCIPGQIEITFPQFGQEVTGVIGIIGSANLPNFGFYKLEIKRPDESIWLTLQAGNTPVINNKLGDWDTRRLTPGDYQLSLVVVDNQAQATNPCPIQVRVAPTLEETPGP